MTALAIRWPEAPRLLPRASGLKFDEVRERVESHHALSFPDTTLSLSTLRLTPEGLVEVPKVGTLSLTPWPKTQLCRLLGIRWDRWFDRRLATGEERKEEIERRLARLPGERTIRAHRYGPGETGEGEGVLRALLSPEYAPLDDVRVFERLERVLDGRSDTLRFVRHEVTDTRSYYGAVESTDLDLGDGDLHRGGFLLRNSEVGAGAVTLYEFFVRLVCTNGLVVSRPGKKLFRRVHRETKDESLDRDLAYAFTLLPEGRLLTLRALRLLQTEAVAMPERELAYLMSDDPEVRPFTERVLDAYRSDPEPTRFGMLQALTRAAGHLPPEPRFTLEHFAGTLLPMVLPS